MRFRSIDRIEKILKVRFPKELAVVLYREGNTWLINSPIKQTFKSKDVALRWLERSGYKTVIIDDLAN